MAEVLIEVCCETSDSTADKGNLLEIFSKRFLETQGLNVTRQVRKTGMEIDLYCQESATGETILVECKAYRRTIAAEVITKLFGSVSLNDYSSGWLISTYALGKDAKGIADEWSTKPEEKRRRLRIYSPEKLIDRLVRTKLIVSPNTLKVPEENGLRAEETYLLITKKGDFWAIPIIDKQTRIPAAAMLFNASDGCPLLDRELTSWLSQTDTSLKQLSWVSEKPRLPNSEKLREELQNIVSVPMADHWADYRPARPVDFIGREIMQRNVFEFFDNVRDRKTSTRLIAIKAPSGWGKSSSVLKIVAKAHNIRNRLKYFVHAVDSRAALTKRFPELAFVSAVNAAMASGFLPKIDQLSFGSAGHFFSPQSMQLVLDALAKENKVICVFFDQFEELLYKEELVEVFEEMRRLCTAVEEAQANVVVGFSWKTDGTITTEHSAYHLWHDLADRRLELDLPPFTDHEVSLAIGRFGKELGQPITQQLRRLLQDHCQGFPWLLKKLCVHILELSRSGADQNDVLTRNLNIITLFKKDIENLTAVEHSCIKQIALESPAEFFKITQTYGDGVVTSLVHKRLIIRSGTRLTIYWDIFPRLYFDRAHSIYSGDIHTAGKFFHHS